MSLFQYSRHSLQQKTRPVFFFPLRWIRDINCQLSLRWELFTFSLKFSALLSSMGNKHFLCCQATLSQHINFNQPSTQPDCMWRYENINSFYLSPGKNNNNIYIKKKNLALPFGSTCLLPEMWTYPIQLIQNIRTRWHAVDLCHNLSIGSLLL